MQTAIQQMIDFINDINDNDRSEFNYYYDSIIAKLNELLEVEKEQLENARPQIISNCNIKEIADDDIKRRIKKEYNYTHYEDRLWMVQGAIWYKEQLKKQQ